MVHVLVQLEYEEYMLSVLMVWKEGRWSLGDVPVLYFMFRLLPISFANNGIGNQKM